MAPVLVTVTGSVLGPDGTGIAGGSIEITLHPPGGSTPDGATEQIVSAVMTVIIASTGAVSFTIVPNSNISPAGSKYRAAFQTPEGFRWTKEWDVDIANGASQDIGDL